MGEVFKVSNTNLVVHIHPLKSKKVPEAIRDQLSSTLLFKFNEAFDGVVLAYKVIEKNEDAKVLTGVYPYLGIRLKAELLLFSPKPNMILEGKVVRLEKEKLHVIVLGFSTASIAEEDTREEFRYKNRKGEDVYASRSHRRHVIKVGSLIRFVVKSMDEETLHISGSLLPLYTGSIKWLDKQMEELPESERSVIMRKRESHYIGLSDEAALQTNASHSKKSKRRKVVKNSEGDIVDRNIY